ncbi:hypothetical protein GLAREA_01188 [Glarea lozoyensis ATCC 20868]|uniref:Uncharacterized protein n=2 Tax=Glarea lozoyensis TaxID=101852 RepID=S3CZP5_GLAL2|nr:uncharacterized protein GLAREA_01188 [Glarea lozoyensis ATCC 20868]EHK97167.1 hypothetical protein M7I_7088 [Glarea lozoyensis 74030]EPE25276.1 hypothetical protein GLAREA_01188 [Glarea lozoyensis ATCC 20868]
MRFSFVAIGLLMSISSAAALAVPEQADPSIDVAEYSSMGVAKDSNAVVAESTLEKRVLSAAEKKAAAKKAALAADKSQGKKTDKEDAGSATSEDEDGSSGKASSSGTSSEDEAAVVQKLAKAFGKTKATATETKEAKAILKAYTAKLALTPIVNNKKVDSKSAKDALKDKPEDAI